MIGSIGNLLLPRLSQRISGIPPRIAS